MAAKKCCHVVTFHRSGIETKERRSGFKPIVRVSVVAVHTKVSTDAFLNPPAFHELKIAAGSIVPWPS